MKTITNPLYEWICDWKLENSKMCGFWLLTSIPSSIMNVRAFAGIFSRKGTHI
jgi:hypothetical protein